MAKTLTTMDRANRTPSQAARVIATVMAVLVLSLSYAGSITLIVSALHTRSLVRPVPGGIQTTGRVVEVQTVWAKDGDVYRPIVAFTDSSNHRIVFSAPTSDDEPNVGDSAQVSYDPDDPTTAHDLSDSSGSYSAPMFAGVAILIVAVALTPLYVWLLVRVFRSRRGSRGRVGGSQSGRLARNQGEPT